MNSTSMRLWAGLFVLVVFVAGGAAGFALRPLVTPAAPVADDPPPPFGRRVPPAAGSPPVRMTERLLDRIAADIELTPEQETGLRELFETRQRRMRAINEEVRGRFEAEQEQMSAGLAEILTEEQMAVFDSEIVRMRRERGSRGERGNPRRPGGFRRGPGQGPGRR